MRPVVFDITTRHGRERVREVWTGVKVAGLTADEIAQARTAGYEPDGEYFIGRDPRRMTPDELRDMKHEPMSVIAALRARCLDCMGGSADEVRKCVAMTCPSWPFRMGKNPWRAPPSEARREAARTLAANRARRIAEQRAARHSDTDSDADEE